jgi:hypothetical protein
MRSVRVLRIGHNWDFALVVSQLLQNSPKKAATTAKRERDLRLCGHGKLGTRGPECDQLALSGKYFCAAHLPELRDSASAATTKKIKSQPARHRPTALETRKGGERGHTGERKKAKNVKEEEASSMPVVYEHGHVCIDHASGPYEAKWNPYESSTGIRSKTVVPYFTKRVIQQVVRDAPFLSVCLALLPLCVWCTIDR